jgi:hypothetical protein
MHMKTDPKKDAHEKDAPSPQGPSGEALGADLVNRGEKGEQGGSAPGAELAAKPNQRDKSTGLDANAPNDHGSEEHRSRRGKEEEAQPLAGTKGGESRNVAEPVLTGEVCCRVTGSNIKYHGRVIEVGTIAEFDAATVREMKDILVPVSRDEAREAEMRACPKCTTDKPCVEHYVKAGYRADTYERRFGSKE